MHTTSWTGHEASENDVWPNAPRSVRPGEVYADHGTLILAPPPSSYVPPPPRSSQPSWSEAGGSWVVPEPRSTSRGPSARTRGDRGMIAALGIGSLAILSGFAAVLLALAADEANVSPKSATASFAPVVAEEVAPVLAAPVVAPPIVVSVPEADFELPSTPPPAPVRVAAAPVVAAPAAAAPVAAAPVAAAPRVQAKTTTKAAPAAAEKTQREILEDLLEQQLAR